MEPHHHSPLPIFLLHEQDLLKMNLWFKKNFKGIWPISTWNSLHISIGTS